MTTYQLRRRTHIQAVYRYPSATYNAGVPTTYMSWIIDASTSVWTSNGHLLFARLHCLMSPPIFFWKLTMRYMNVWSNLPYIKYGGASYLIPPLMFTNNNSKLWHPKVFTEYDGKSSSLVLCNVSRAEYNMHTHMTYKITFSHIWMRNVVSFIHMPSKNMFCLLDTHQSLLLFSCNFNRKWLITLGPYTLGPVVTH